jgi:DNA-binding LytR/AlgR family response regulator
MTRQAGGVADPETASLRVLVVDDEAPAREELTYLLGHDERVGQVRCASSGPEALRMLGEEPADVVFCDLKMPGLQGMELAHVLSRFAERPQIVFVTAYDDHAVEAFELQATDYVMKPVRADRLAEAVRRVVSAGAGAETIDAGDETIPVELAGVIRFVSRSQVRYVEAQGDYARLHTASGSHLVRTPLSVLEERWAHAGFVRIHRSTLVSLAHVDEVRVAGGRCSVWLGGRELPVSRRHTRELRERVTHSAHPHPDTQR